MEKFDIKSTKKLLAGEKIENYSKIYMNSNENMYILFKNFSVENKKVLTVLSSSDQFFCCYYLGAKSVDSFDCNRLTEYYFYLRRWLLEYKNCFFNLSRKAVLNNKIIDEILRNVKCQGIEDERAYNYWCKYLESGLLIKKLFYEDIYDSTFEELVSDMDKLKEIVKNSSLNFRHQDISGNIDKKNKYERVIVSNILEYYSLEEDKLKRCRDNLYDILEDDGEVICTNMSKDRTSIFEKEIFKEKFEFREFDICQNSELRNFPVGYSYIKK